MIGAQSWKVGCRTSEKERGGGGNYGGEKFQPKNRSTLFWQKAVKEQGVI